MEDDRFDLGYCILGNAAEDIFLSVTTGFERGPGIHRDGKTEPRMLDPHDPAGGKMTSHAFVQRAGTWTIYHHLKHFVDQMGKEWRILGAQSNGDLTMNPWHVAFLGRSRFHAAPPVVCALLLEESNREPIETRHYRCLVKWTAEAGVRRGKRYEFLNVSMEPGAGGNSARLCVDSSAVDEIARAFLRLKGYSGHDEIGNLVEFALSGKPIIERKEELALPNVIDRFQDIRHVFNIPMIPTPEGNINLGEFQLFGNLNERRAALNAPVLIDLDVPDHEPLMWETLRSTLQKKIHFQLTERSPTKRGEFRWYPGDQDKPRIEIFFHPGVYPFGSLGMRDAGAATGTEPASEIVSLSCGGLSGRVGNTLEGVCRMMYDYFRCDDAMVLDEGLDVCLIVNKKNEKEKYTNEEMLHKVWSFTREQLARDERDSLKKLDPSYPTGMKTFPLNEELVKELDTDFAEPIDYSDVFRVTPGRSQIRSMLIFAERATT
jgi:hypothetical protein